MIRFALAAQLLLLHFSPALACISVGCFGGLGFGCAPGCPPFGMCLSTPACYGRFCARARGAKTYKDESTMDQSLKNIQDPNEHFLTCCGLLDVPLQCLQMCTFDGYNVSSVQSILAMTSACPVTALPQIHFCAARGVDHTQCCRATGLHQQCLMFCDQSPDTTNQLSLQQLGCIDGFDGMKDCFVEHALTEYYRSKQAAFDNYQRIQIN